MNSLYDPNYEVGGQQPYSYDSWGQWYQKYKVFAAKVRVRVDGLHDPDNLGSAAGLTNAALPNLMYYIQMKQSDAQVDFSDRREIRTLRNMMIKRINVQADYRKQKMKMYRTVRSVYGKRIDDADWESEWGANPAAGCFIHVGAYRDDIGELGPSSLNVHLSVMITFYSLIFDPVPITVD